MKNIFWIIGIVFILSSCSHEKHQMLLSGEIKGLKKGTVLLQKANDTTLYTVDSISIDSDSQFSFSEIVETPEIYFLRLKIENESLLDKSLSFFAEEGKITINTTLENFNLAAVISGSKNQQKHEEFRKLIQRYTDKNLDLLQQEIEAVQNQNDSLQEQIHNQRQRTLTGKYLATVNFAINNNDYELAPYLMLSEVFDTHVKYLDTVFNALTPKIKDSKYGKALESFIQERKKSDTN